MSLAAKRYAVALFELARERDQLDNVQEELTLIANSVKADDTFARFLAHPRFSAQQKREVMLNAFGDHLSDISQNFIKLLIDKGRQAELSFIAEEYVALANHYRGVSAGVAVTAVQLTKDELTQLEAMFTKLLRKSVQLKNTVAREIQGGVLVKVADRIYDGSVAGKLARFQKQLQKTQV